MGAEFLRPRDARRRVGGVKRGFAAASAVAFVAALVLARATHPGHSSATQAGTTSGTNVGRGESDDGRSDDGFSFGSASISPSTGSSSVQSGGS